eukprot:CAMPEP_0204832476 /NCGR_PEP_ID=MMETSP1346-20131115/13809_1 /ASSEMBLY_ACC=CAM_ASM_000771 /TAXON_ID=215587 /ORGANISM="Aplanochytrium stocchinoi, Strain GSBS06" /LENGTH=501 /DNA_ID=CAMNT_0051964311 /DNA_START=344 /DNA_END=1846 /DNA_ORIENTATION=-
MRLGCFSRYKRTKTKGKSTGANNASVLCPHTFLLGTLDSTSPVSILRGKPELLKKIWCLVCEEWWAQHIENFYGEIPELGHINIELDRTQVGVFLYPSKRQAVAGIPCATIKKDVSFPALTTIVSESTFTDKESSHLYINMMPIDLKHLEDSLPEICLGYREMILICMNKMYNPAGETQIAYLTIDERPVTNSNIPQRRGGLHVDSPGFLPLATGSENRKDVQRFLDGDGNYVPGAEHYWGNGIMMRDETMHGGIFMTSNVSGSCAVWNAYVLDDKDDHIIGPHGNVERYREYLGHPTKILEAGELVWMTDKTPHESLPFKGNIHRQYFRLVTGPITAWFSNHSTANPLGITPPKEVQIIHGNKFEIYPTSMYHEYNYHVGSKQKTEELRNVKEMHKFLYNLSLRHLGEAFTSCGLKSVSAIINEVLEGRELRPSFDNILGRDNWSFMYYENRILNVALCNSIRLWRTCAGGNGFTTWIEEDIEHERVQFELIVHKAFITW